MTFLKRCLLITANSMGPKNLLRCLGFHYSNKSLSSLFCRWHIELQDFATKDKLLESGLEFRKPKMSKKRTNSIKRASVSRN